MKTWLILDVHYLCHRAFHTTRGLTNKDIPVGVIFGFLKSLSSLKNDFGTEHLAFCFEHPRLFRRDIYPGYKRKRQQQERTPEEAAAYSELIVQIAELKKKYLPMMGMENVFSYRGMESDDIMAQIALSQRDKAEVVLVTSDNDLLQCLAPNVSMWSPSKRKLYTERWFEREYGFPPRKWALVKAIAGCPSDEVNGIKGVGEKTAVKYIRKELMPTTAAYQNITSEDGRRKILRNKQLVKLPFANCPTPELKDCRIDREGWKAVCKMLGFKSMIAPP